MKLHIRLHMKDRDKKIAKKKTYTLYMANEQFRITLPKVLVQSANLRVGDKIEILNRTW